MDELIRYKEQYLQEIAKPNNLLLIMESAAAFLSIWNPAVGSIIRAVLSTMKFGINAQSGVKAKERIELMMQSIDKIIEKQKEGQSNFEAAIICPQLFRNTLIYSDVERAKEQLKIIEKMFSSGEINFNDISEALKLISQLTDNEYRLLKEVPKENILWKDFICISDVSKVFKEDKERLAASLLSLIGMNLVVRKLAIRFNGGPEMGTINFDDDMEYIRLSEYGALFIDTIKEVSV